jgi:alpha-glucosidase/alpha-D-xyloside xylohydrolase
MAIVLAVCAWPILATTGAWAAPLGYRGAEAELTISQISERAVRIIVAPLDPASGQPLAPPESAVLVEQNPQVVLRSRNVESDHLVSAGKLRIVVHPQPLAIEIRNAAGDLVQEFAIGNHDGSMTFRASAPVLGMGEGAQQFDRRGAEYSMRDGWGEWERPTHGSWVAVPLVIGTDGWALFVHHPFGKFDLRGETASFTPTPREEDGETPLEPLVAYIIAWDEPADVLAEYKNLVGAAPLPPKWALGFMQSHRTLAGPGEVLEVARTFREKRLPCDALIYLGTGYCPAGWNTGHASLDFNPATWDKPAEMINALHEMDFRVVLHVNAPPRRLTGKEVTGVDTPDATGRQGRGRRRASTISDYWARHRETFALGVDGWWPDDGDELDRESRIARHKLYYQGPLLDRPNVRPWNLQRTGYAGVARYGGWIWSGDVDSRWETLKTHVAIGQNHSLSLSPYWGSDIGGFYPGPELTGELYVRWFQFGAFCPSFRAHGRTWHLRRPWGWNAGDAGPIEHNDWRPPESDLTNGEVEPICRKYLELRYRLLPYTYTLCRVAHDTGLPLMRPLWLHYPDDEQAITRGDEYLWGRDILVAPVTERGAAEWTLYLPEGQWYDFWTSERQSGGREITRTVDLATMPLYVRAGAIVPLDPVRQHTGETVNEPTSVRIYTGADGKFRWYDDDGASLEYERGQFAWTRLTWDDEARRLTIAREGGDGELVPPPRTLVVEIMPGGEKRTVEYDGRRAEIHVDE